MNGRERVEAVMSGETTPDRVPVMCQLSFGHLIRNSDIPPAEFYLRYNDICVETNIRLTDAYRFDGFLMEFGGKDEADLRSRVDRITDEKDGQTIHWKNGDETFCPVNDYPIEKPRDPPKKPDFVDVDITDLLNRYNVGYATKTADLPGYYMAPFAAALERAGDRYSIHTYYASPLSLLMHMHGIQETILGLIDHPDAAKRHLERIVAGCKLWVDTLVETGMPVVAVTAPYEGAGMLSPSMFEEFGLPYLKTMVDYVKSKEVFTYLHMCGSINDRLETIASTGIDGIECLDPPPIGDVELGDAVRRIGDRVFIKGNIDPVNTLYTKTPGDVYEDAARRIEIGRQTERYIISTACSVAPDTPQENLAVIVEAAEKYGRY